MLHQKLNINVESLTELNKLMVDTYGQLVEAQIESLRGYMGLVEDQARAVSTIRDVDGLQTFMKEQPERLHELVQRISHDFESFAQTTGEFRDEVSQVFRDCFREQADAEKGQAGGDTAVSPEEDKNAS